MLLFQRSPRSRISRRCWSSSSWSFWGLDSQGGLAFWRQRCSVSSFVSRCHQAFLPATCAKLALVLRPLAFSCHILSPSLCWLKQSHQCKHALYGQSWSKAFIPPQREKDPGDMKRPCCPLFPPAAPMKAKTFRGPTYHTFVLAYLKCEGKK